MIKGRGQSGVARGVGAEGEVVFYLVSFPSSVHSSPICRPMRLLRVSLLIVYSSSSITKKIFNTLFSLLQDQSFSPFRLLGSKSSQPFT